jgi:hypothetical protein
LRHQFIDVSTDLRCGGFIILDRGYLQQVPGVRNPAVQLFDGGNDDLEGRAFPAQILRALRVFPYAGLSQFQFYLGEAFLAIVEVKGTP